MYSGVKAIYYLNPYVRLLYEQRHLFIAAEKCIKILILKKIHTLQAKENCLQVEGKDTSYPGIQ